MSRNLPKLIIILLVLMEIGPLPASAQTAFEYEVKAAFLLNFTRFIDWPEEAFAGPDSPFVIGVVAKENPFRGWLEGPVQGETVHGRPIRLRFSQTLEGLGPAQIVFVGRSLTKSEQLRILAQLQGQPVLTVGESPDFTANGGMIRFFVREGRMAFEVNRAAVDEAGVRISSRLLALADIYGETGQTNR